MDHLGNVDTSTTFTAGASEYFRGLGSLRGESFYVGGSIGIKYVARNAQRAVAAVVTTGTFNMRAMEVRPNGDLIAGVATTPYGVMRLPAPLPTAATNVSVLDRLIPNVAATTYVTAFHFDDAGGLFVVFYYGLNGALVKYTQSAQGAWVQDPAYPKMTSTFAYTHPTAGVGLVTPYGLKSLTGFRRPSDGNYILALLTYHSTSCTAVTTSFQYCSSLLFWDSTAAPMGATFIANSASPYQAFVGIGWAPSAPSSSPSPSVSPTGSAASTPSATATSSSTITEGASASATHTADPTPPETPSGSPTASTSASPSTTPSNTRTPPPTLSAYPSYGGVPFTTGNLAVLKVGDGVAALSANGAAGFVLEMNPVTGAIVQTIALPTVSGLVNGRTLGSCVFSGTATSDVTFSAFTNGLGLAIGCYSSGVSGTTYSGAWRTAVALGADGSIDAGTVFSMMPARCSQWAAASTCAALPAQMAAGSMWAARSASRPSRAARSRRPRLG